MHVDRAGDSFLAREKSLLLIRQMAFLYLRISLFVSLTAD